MKSLGKFIFVFLLGFGLGVYVYHKLTVEKLEPLPKVAVEDFLPTHVDTQVYTPPLIRSAKAIERFIIKKLHTELPLPAKKITDVVAIKPKDKECKCPTLFRTDTGKFFIAPSDVGRYEVKHIKIKHRKSLLVFNLYASLGVVKIMPEVEFYFTPVVGIRLLRIGRFGVGAISFSSSQKLKVLPTAFFNVKQFSFASLAAVVSYNFKDKELLFSLGVLR